MSARIDMLKRILVCGAGGFIGSHFVKRLKAEGHWVRGVDHKYPEFSETHADDFVLGDLRDPGVVEATIDREFGEICQLAADMGGAGFIFTGDNDADIMHNSALINSDNRLIVEKLGWRPSEPLSDGLAKAYAWIEQQVAMVREAKGRPASD